MPTGNFLFPCCIAFQLVYRMIYHSIFILSHIWRLIKGCANVVEIKPADDEKNDNPALYWRYKHKTESPVYSLDRHPDGGRTAPRDHFRYKHTSFASTMLPCLCVGRRCLYLYQRLVHLFLICRYIFEITFKACQRSSFRLSLYTLY